MSYRTVEVQLENGRVRPSGVETLPVRAQALLVLLDDKSSQVSSTCAELAHRWAGVEQLAESEAIAFADDLEKGRASLLPLKPAWD
jgi:hypothetical protein